MKGKRHITCPECGRTSHNQNDVEHGYCGYCHWFTKGLVSETELVESEETMPFAGAFHGYDGYEPGYMDAIIVLRLLGKLSDEQWNQKLAEIAKITAIEKGFNDEGTEQAEA